MNICAIVGIKTEFSLDEIAAILSEWLCGGIKFGGQDDYVREEIPAVYTQRDYLGLRLVLYGEHGDYGLDVEQWKEQELGDVGEEYVDLSKHLLILLSRIEGLHPHLGNDET